MRTKKEKLELLKHINKIFPSKHWSIKKIGTIEGDKLYEFSFRKKPIIRTFHRDITFVQYVLTEGFIFERCYVNGILKIICKLRKQNGSKTEGGKITI